MPNSISATGLTTATQSELITNFTNSLQALYGPNVNLQSNTIDGQWINNFIQAILDVQDLITTVNSMFDPDQAVGVILDQRVAINGIQRQAATYTVTNVTVTTSQSVNLYGLDQSIQPVYTLQDTFGNQWQLITTQIALATGTNVLAFRSATPGAIVSTPNTIIVPVTVVLGVSSVNNPTAFTTLGINEETDAALRLRRQISVALASQGYLQGLLAALENIPGITSAFVYENVTGSPDGNGIPGHSIWAIVAGTASPDLASAYNSSVSYQYGQLASSGNTNYISWQNNNMGNSLSDAAFWGVYNPVAMAIYFKRNAGCGMKGATSYTVTQVDGSPFIISWDTVVTQNLFIAFIATSINGTNPPNIAAILKALPSLFVPGIAAEVNINQLATFVQQADSNTLVTSAGLSLAGTQTLSLSGIAASGAFKLNYNGNQTSSINWNDSVGTIQTKVQAVTGLGSATVSGSIASQSLVITVPSPVALIYASNNTLQTSAPAAITFSYSEGYGNTISPTAANNQLSVSLQNIVITSIQIAPSSLQINKGGSTQQFLAYGGYGVQSTTSYANTSGTWALTTNNSGGNITSGGLYTSGSTGGGVMDVATVTDLFGNTATVTITVN